MGELIRARNHGVNPEFIQELRREGYDSVSLDELIRPRNHGVTAEFIQRMSPKGFRGCPLNSWSNSETLDFDLAVICQVAEHSRPNVVTMPFSNSPLEEGEEHARVKGSYVGCFPQSTVGGLSSSPSDKALVLDLKRTTIGEIKFTPKGFQSMPYSTSANN